MIILVDKAKLDFIKKAIQEKNVVYDITKSDGEFFRYYGMTKEAYKAMMKGFEREIMNAEKCLNENIPEKIVKFINENKEA